MCARKGMINVCKSGRFALLFLSFCIAMTVGLGRKSCWFRLLWLSNWTIKRLVLQKNAGFFFFKRTERMNLGGGFALKRTFSLKFFKRRKRGYLQLGILNVEF